MTDPIADLLTQIRNAAAVRKPFVLVPFSRVKLQISEILAREGWVERVETIEKAEDSPVAHLKLRLKYDKDGRSVVRSIRRISKPGRRVYVGADQLPRVLNNLGMAVMSTSRGIMTNRDAKRAKIGGEVLCEIT